MNENVIEIKDVSFTYKDHAKASLEHVNLQVKKGEVVVLCGESGCGKSTLIRLINGLIPFYHDGKIEGSVQVMGEDTGKGSIYDLGSKVSTVFQNPKSQFFCVDVKSELAFAAENLKFDRKRILDRIEGISSELNLEHLLEKTMFQLSGGEKQKIACASVMVTDNPIIVLDEPSSNLDVYAIGELKKMIRYWKEKGKTIVIAEHRLQYLKDMASRFVYMKKGRILRIFEQEEMNRLSSAQLAEMGLRSLDYSHLLIENKKISDSFLKLTGCSFKYKGSRMPNLSIEKLRIPKASVIAIIGRNGAGKSTFVRCFCGLEKKAKGMAEDERSRCKLKKMLDYSFLVMQDVNHQLFTESVEEEILLSMKEKDNHLLQQVLTELDIDGNRKQHPMSLSGGQKQRTAVACAMVSQRENIIFDEPTSGLDYFHMQQVAECILHLQKKGKTVFLITHDIELIYACCNYVLQIENGMVQELYQLNDENEEKLGKFFIAY